VYASLIVQVEAPGIKQPLTYAVPEALSGLRPGDCVVVPFGRQEALAYVVALNVALPGGLEPDAIKEIQAQVTGDGAAIPGPVLKTAQWMAREYLCDLVTAIKCVIPDMQAAHLVKRTRLAEGWEELLPEITTTSHRQLLTTLSGFPGGAATKDELSDALGGAKIDSPLRLLKLRGMLQETYTVEPPRIGAKLVRAAKLLVVWDDAEAEAKKRETKAPAQAKLLRALALAGGGPIPVAELVKEAGASPAALKKLEADGLVETEVLALRRRPYALKFAAVVAPELMGEQQVALDEIKRRLDAKKHHVALLYGVTGSGKTEVYLRAIAECRRRGRTALVLVPEIALTAQVVDSFRSRIGDRVAVLHSGLSQGERRDEWQRIGRGEADVVVGARSAVFAPLEGVGLIVVDEEHEGSYKQDQPSPRYHARDVAIARARATDALVLLGSATPAVETFFKAQSGEFGFIPLRERALSRPLPLVEVVDLREGFKKGDPRLFAPSLTDAIGDRLAKNEQTILFLNRRGFAMFLICRDCGFTTRCPSCDVSLTFHQRAALCVCHHCGYELPAPAQCPSCNGSRLKPFGVGTEKIEEEVKKAFPSARVIRMDRDTTQAKNAHLTMLRQFRTGEADILIGTQMVAKGLDFPNVTLVGVISADTALNLPDFRASERAFQLLTQVSGRAGRGRKLGEVIVQSFNPEHESIAAASHHDYEAFYKKEIEYRRELGYPPFSRLANVVCQDEDARVPEQKLARLASFLDDSPDIRKLGPALCPLGRLRGKWRWHLLLKAQSAEELRASLRKAFSLLTSSERSGITVDIDPLSLL
jgi:primosomal protein N' (replication factor Y) (superfamily II helicase)